jgi:hypothetical protein
MERKELEQKLGQVMHAFAVQQDIVAKEQETLKKLQENANSVDRLLKELDGK